MTPAERQLVAQLFDRLATLEDAQRDPDAEKLIEDGLRQAPNALYALVQTTLVQEQALKDADARIRQLEAQAAQAGGPQRAGADPFAGAADLRGSVPSVRPAPAAPAGASIPAAAPPGMGAAPQPMPAGPAPQPQGGGSFLGTAAAAAAGAIGGALLMNALRGMMGGPQPGAHGFGGPGHAGGGMPWGGGGAGGPGGGTPWGGGGAGGTLGREAGLDDIGQPRGGGPEPFGAEAKRGGDTESRQAEAEDRPFESASAEEAGEGSHEEPAEDAALEDDADYSDDDADLGGDDSDFGGDDGGDSGGDDSGGED
jgi:hypothetical protein